MIDINLLVFLWYMKDDKNKFIKILDLRKLKK